MTNGVSVGSMRIPAFSQLEWIKILLGLVGLGLIVFAYWFQPVEHDLTAYLWLVAHWSNISNYSHGPLIPLIASALVLWNISGGHTGPPEKWRHYTWAVGAYIAVGLAPGLLGKFHPPLEMPLYGVALRLTPWLLAWQIVALGRPLMERMDRPVAGAIGAVAVAMVIYYFGVKAIQPRIVVLSFVLLLYAITLVAGGRGLMRVLFFPITFLLLMVPLNFLDTAGTDVLVGGAGNDNYIVTRSTGISITENAGEGTDTVQASVTYALGAELENLSLTGANAINGTGNSTANVLTGNAAANVLDGQAGADTLIGAAGNDTYVVADAGDVVTENASEGTDQVNSSVTYTAGSNVENLVLTGTAAINATGNTLANSLTGNSANNVLDGGTGADTLFGGAGNDTYTIDNAADVITESAGQGTDLAQSSITFTLGNTDIENLTLTGTAANGTGNALNNVISGNASSNILTGIGGDDTLDPGSAGTDSLLGGTGNDTYIISRSTGITVTENASEGTDAIQASVTYTLGTNLENLTLTGATAINGTGNASANILIGNSAINTLDGQGGADTMSGGLGDDIYVVDNASDAISENAAEGTDLVQSIVTFTIADVDVESLTLTSTGAINATGNASNNVLTGNTGANTLTGLAGNDTLWGGASAGATVDVLVGGSGDDTYTVDRTSGITLTESAAEGTDLVQSSVAYTLLTNFENLTLTSTGAINGTGNSVANVLTGNSGANTLMGMAGNDTLWGGASTGTTVDVLVGGLGDDTFTVDRTSNITITENASEGIDVENASVTATLAANVEILFLTGSSANNGTGNALANLLRGNTAINTLVGVGGNDILEGGAGNDTLSNTAGKNLFNGGAGDDTITGAAGNELIIGGAGNDTITTGAGADILGFNRGDGLDIVNASTTKDNVVSLGGGITYADLLFKKNANDLILVTGTNEQITFKDYYLSTSNRSVDRLQVVIEGTSDYNSASTDPTKNKKIETFDFGQLVAAFDAARVATPGLTQWALTNSLTTYFLSGSDTAAIGGDLSYQYNRFGNLGNVSFTPAQGILASASFGTAAQTLQALGSLQDSTPRLS